jgi:hypothetical protein
MRDAYGRWQPTPKEPTPTPRMMARIAEARQRNAARLERPSLEVKRISEKVIHTDITSDMAETLLDTFGTTSGDFVHAELSRLPGEQTEINAALAAIDAAPESHWGDLKRAGALCGASRASIMRQYSPVTSSRMARCCSDFSLEYAPTSDRMAQSRRYWHAASLTRAAYRSSGVG